MTKGTTRAATKHTHTRQALLAHAAMMAEKTNASGASGHGVRSLLAASPSTMPSQGLQQHHHHAQEDCGGAAYARAGQPQQQQQQQLLLPPPLPGSFIPYDLGIPWQQQHNNHHHHHAAMHPLADMGATKSGHQQHGQSASVGFPPQSAKPSSRKRPAPQQHLSPSASPFSLPLTPPSQHQYQHQSISGQVLGENSIPVLRGVRQGELLNGVGLLPSLYADFMRGYEVRMIVA